MAGVVGEVWVRMAVVVVLVLCGCGAGERSSLAVVVAMVVKKWISSWVFFPITWMWRRDMELKWVRMGVWVYV